MEQALQQIQFGYQMIDVFKTNICKMNLESLILDEEYRGYNLCNIFLRKID